MSIVYRHIEKHEQQQALDLWYSTFKCNPGFYERYFSLDASPYYQDGDALSAWHNDKLVSTVYIRRFRLRSREDDEEYLCGGIANVATVTEYRRQGLSRRLLNMAIDKMKRDAFDVSMLGTENQMHYAVLGWESLPEPNQIVIDWKNPTSCNKNIEWHSASDVLSNKLERMLKIYSNEPRIYQIDRSPISTFQHWVKWEWHNDTAIVCLWEKGNEQGYVVIGKPDSNTDICILEWRAPSIDLEQMLLSLAAAEIRRRHGQTTVIHLWALPQFMTIDQLIEWAGPITTDVNDDAMIRNIRLSNETYEKIKTAYINGSASFWSGDFY